MSDLVRAAQAVLDRWDSPQWQWSKQGPTADLMSDLRRALEQQAEPQSCPDYAACRDDTVRRLHAEVERLRALLNSTVELAEYWINREDRRGMSEGEWRTWHSLGYGSNTMIAARAELKEGQR